VFRKIDNKKTITEEMKTVEKVSIAEISFTLDSDAYSALKQYLDSLHAYYADDPDGREITRDIEARIGELILEEQVYTKVVSRPLIDRIIAQLGTPDQIDDQGDPIEGADGGGSSSTDGSLPRRLHRSAEGKILGGVCSGIARYWDINVVWVRLAFLFPILVSIFFSPFHWNSFEEFVEGWSWGFLVTYIVLWIALPMARTPRQRLEARGEKITPASIRQNMQESVSTPAGRKAASVAAELLTVLGRVVLFFVKFVTAVVGFSLLFTAIAIFMGMGAVLFDPASISLVSGETIITVLEGMAVMSPLIFVELVLLCVLLPLGVIGMALLSFTFNWRLGRVFYGVTLGVWGVAIILVGIVSASNVRFLHDELPYRIEQWDDRHDRNDERWESSEDRRRDRDRISVDSLEVVPVDSLESVSEEASGEMRGRSRVEIRRVD
jgi:phage shock protein PspC (stress-responsive transcriptional regulator)